MRLPFRTRLPCLLACGLLLALPAISALSPALTTGAAPGSQERGFPLIQAYDPGLPDAETQNFAIDRDPRGFVYVGNGGGVLVYDGAWWRLIPIGKTKAVFSLASDARGRIGVGGVDELGYLAPDSGGTLRYVSLVGQLPPEQRSFGQVLRMAVTEKGFAFLTEQWLFLWDGAQMITAAKFPGGRPFATIFPVDNDVLAWTRAGISRLAGTKLEPLAGGEVFRDRRIDLILPADGGLLVSVRGEGLFLFKNGQAKPFAPAASRWTAEKRLHDGIRLADGRWALGSILGGMLLLRPDGEIDQVIDTSVGLADNFVNGAMVDREGSLWLALNNGLARIEVASPLSVIDRRTGLEGSVYTVARHLGKLWVGTAAGLFTTEGTERAAGDPKVPDWGLPVRVRTVPGPPPSVWSLVSVDQDLLVGTADGPYLIRGTTAQALAGASQQTAYVLTRSRRDPDRVWLGTSEGLGAIRREAGVWRFEGMVPGFTHEIRSIEEGENGVLWCATEVDGLWRVELDAGTPPRTVKLRQIPGGDSLHLNRIGGRIVAATGETVLRLDETTGRLVDDPSLTGMRRKAVSLTEDAAGNVWMASHPPAVVLRQGSGWAAKARSLVEVPGHSVLTIVTEPDGVVWLCGDDGLYRYAGTAHNETPALPAPPLAQVTSSGDKLLFGGAPGAAPKAVDLPPYLRRLRIEFAPLSFRAGLRFQTRLEPIDAGWSGPTAEPFAELTRLPPGSYTFHVRTSGPSGEVGPETSWSFRVLHPWYETSWAIAGWIALAIAALTGYVRLRSRALRQRAARLEARVAEQTVELRNTVEELQHAHAGLASANARLEELSLRDELTGLANRRHLRQVLEVEWDRAQRLGAPLGFILLDLDFFKLLNDTRGHREGDRCLQAVALHLAESLKRPGDLAARYGGEELAVLLPYTDLTGALQVAEQLRDGIERLAIPHTAVPLGHVTASFGVAALIPAPDQRPEILVDAADLALYRAKTAGRNRVRAAGADETGEHVVGWAAATR
ncbi:MAG TPA: diguanylate cyclase [Thermoanaerobaculia bacterium]|jgi:diguanylate cyclase (GGDEF)-like protein|nr:diguanylate cyclase [Thermoanaerobaculia bacterium]